MATPIIVRSDIEAVVGASNVIKWADLDNTRDNDIISARVSYACQLATDMIYGKLRLMTYNVDTVVSNTLIKHVTAIQAADILYGPRRPTDAKPGEDQMKAYRDEGKALIKEIASGRLDLGLPRQCCPYPIVVRCDRNGDPLSSQDRLPSGIVAIWRDE